MSEQNWKTSPDHENTGWPKGVPYIVGNEMCERFSYYGMRAILTVHLVSLYVLAGQAEDVAKDAATGAYHLFAGAVYAVPMLGAILADRFWGKYNTILWLSLMYCVGHGILAVADIPADPNTRLLLVYIGLGCIAIGAGGIKPCVSANVGDQFGRGNWFRVQTIYQIFYFSINFGSFFATLLIPFIRGDGTVLWRTSLAFGVPGILMGIATFFFWMGRAKFVHIPPKPGGKLGKLDTLAGSLMFLAIGHLYVTPAEWGWTVRIIISVVCFAAGLGVFMYRQGIEQDDGFLAILVYNLRAKLTGEEAAPLAGAGAAPKETLVEDAAGAGGSSSSAAVRGIDPDKNSTKSDSPLVESAFWSKFWGPAIRRFGLEAAEGPHAVLKVCTIFIFIPVFWAIFDQHGSTWILQAQWMDTTLMSGITALPEQVSAANPLMVMALIPIMNIVFRISGKVGFEATPLRRMVVGLMVAGASFAIAALIQQGIDPHVAEAMVAGVQQCTETGIEGMKQASMAAFQENFIHNCSNFAEGQWAQGVVDAAAHCTPDEVKQLAESVALTYKDYPATCDAWKDTSFFRIDYYANVPGRVSIWWQILAYLVLTTSEVLVSITALEFAYTQAPKRMKSIVMGLFLLTVTLGNAFVTIMTGAKDAMAEMLGGEFGQAEFFWFFCWAAVIVGALMGVRALFYKQRDFTQD